jgi:hypothetical protein
MANVLRARMVAKDVILGGCVTDAKGEDNRYDRN